MIPRERLHPGAVRTLLDYLKEDITTALSERRPLEEKWLRYQRLYRAQPEQRVKKFPFYGASNLVLPVAATDVDTINARLMGILFGPENLWATRALREDFVEWAPRLQEFLRWAQAAELNAYNAVADWLLELTKLGTGILKERYRREERLAYEFRETPMGTLERFQRVMAKDNPVIEHVSLFDFLIPSGTIDHQQAPWNAERVMLSREQLVQRARAGIYTNIDAVLRHTESGTDPWHLTQQHRMGGVVPSRPRKAEIWETWVDFDISGFGEPQALVCSLHLPTMTYLRIDYNPFFHQEKPFDAARYQRVEKQFYGIGICEMDEMFQEETTAMHNQRIDAGTLSNSPMMKVLNTEGIKEDEPIIPGRWFVVKDMRSIEPMNFGRTLDSTIDDEEMTRSYAVRRVGVNDYVMGNSSAAVGYATAQTNIMQHQEAAKRFDQTLREVRIALGSAGRRCVELYQQFDTKGKEFTVLGEKDGSAVRQILQFPLEMIRSVVAIEVTATSASLNKEVQIRTNTIMMQMVMQFYQQMFQLMSMAVNPQLPPPLRMVAEQAVVGSNTLMRRTLDAYDMQDIDKILPNLMEIVNGQQQALAGLGVPGDPSWASAQQALGPGGGPGAAGPVQAPGMAAVPYGA